MIIAAGLHSELRSGLGFPCDSFLCEQCLNVIGNCCNDTVRFVCTGNLMHMVAPWTEHRHMISQHFNQDLTAAQSQAKFSGSLPSEPSQLRLSPAQQSSSGPAALSLGPLPLQRPLVPLKMPLSGCSAAASTTSHKRTCLAPRIPTCVGILPIMNAFLPYASSCLFCGSTAGIFSSSHHRDAISMGHGRMQTLVRINRC